MTYTRLLTIDDASQVLSVIGSQDKFKFGPLINIDVLKTYYTNAKCYDKSNFTEMFGLFEDDGILDCFWILIYPTRLSIRADDPTKKDKAAILHLVYSRKKPNRQKNAGGLDINQLELQARMVDYLEQNGYYSRWFVTPATFSSYLDDPDYVKAVRYKYSYVMTPLPANTAPTDQYMATNVAKITFPVDMKIYLVSMKEEYRTNINKP